MERFKRDLQKKKLMPIKVLMFLIYGGQATLYPYFTVHLKSLGVSIKQTAIIFAVQPIVAVLVAPMVGMVADKIGNFKLIFSFFLIFSAVSANLLLLVPPVPIKEKLLQFQLRCDSNDQSSFHLLPDDSCQINSKRNTTYLNITLKFNCYQECLNEAKLVLPLVYLERDEKSCNYYCDNSDREKCATIQQNYTFEMFLELPKNHSYLVIPPSHYFLNYKDKIYDRFSCVCLPSECNTTCKFVSQQPVNECMDALKNKDFGVTFWAYLGIRLVVTLGIGLVNGLFDAASMVVIQEQKADVGFQRFWSTVAMCIFAPISGFFIDEYDSFKPCFFMYGALYLVAAITSLNLDLGTKIPAENPLRNLVLLLRNPELILLLIQIAVLGICWGFLENFLFWFLESELNANNLMMGLTVTVGSGTGLFMALVATWCTKKLGYVNVIILAFAAYTVRFIGYAVAENAYVCLIFEMMENFTVTLLTVGVTLYCTELASIEMLTTVMTLWNGLHIISGRAFGSLLGGFLVNNHGFRQTFFYFAFGSASFGLFYALVYILWLRSWRIRKGIVSYSGEGQRSSMSDDTEEETMKTEAFTSLSLHCSFDSPGLVSYLPELPDTEFRRRALSHTPASMNSFRETIPRHAVSFSEGKRLPYSVELETSRYNASHNFVPNLAPYAANEVNVELVTRL